MLYLEEENSFSSTTTNFLLSAESWTISLCEVPSGIVADMFGRKRTIVLAMLLHAAGAWFLWGANLSSCILAFVLTGFARSLWSGTDDAMLSDAIKAGQPTNSFFVANYFSMMFVGMGAASVVGSHLSTQSYDAVIRLSPLPLLVGLGIAAMCLNEVPYKKVDHRNILSHVFDSARYVSKSSSLRILVLSAIPESLGWVIFFNIQVWLKSSGLSIIEIGWSGPLFFFASFLGSLASKSISDLLGPRSALVTSALCSSLCYLIPNLIHNANPKLFVVFYILHNFAFGCRMPLISILTNEAPSSHRATIGSLRSFSVNAGLAIAAPIFGLLTDRSSMAFGITVFAVFSFAFPATLCFLPSMESSKGNKKPAVKISPGNLSKKKGASNSRI